MGCRCSRPKPKPRLPYLDQIVAKPALRPVQVKPKKLPKPKRVYKCGCIHRRKDRPCVQVIWFTNKVEHCRNFSYGPRSPYNSQQQAYEAAVMFQRQYLTYVLSIAKRS